MYSYQLTNAVKKYLEENDKKYEFHEEQGTFLMKGVLNDELNECTVIIMIREDMIITCATIDVSADNENVDAVEEYITRANSNTKIGKFTLNYNGGEIVYMVTTDCAGGAIPTNEIIENAIYVPIAMFFKYGEGLLDVLAGFDTPEDAIEAAEADEA